MDTSLISLSKVIIVSISKRTSRIFVLHCNEYFSHGSFITLMNLFSSIRGYFNVNNILFLTLKIIILLIFWELYYNCSSKSYVFTILWQYFFLMLLRLNSWHHISSNLPNFYQHYVQIIIFVFFTQKFLALNRENITIRKQWCSKLRLIHKYTKFSILWKYSLYIIIKIYTEMESLENYSNYIESTYNKKLMPRKYWYSVLSMCNVI